MAVIAGMAMVKTLQRAGRFSGLSLLSFLTNIGLVVLFHEILRLPEELAYACSLILVFLLNFFTLRTFVFQHGKRSASGQFLRFLLFSLAFRGSEYLMFLLLFKGFAWHYLLVVILVSITAMITKFFVYRSHVFS